MGRISNISVKIAALVFGALMLLSAFLVKLLGLAKDYAPGRSAPYNMGFGKNLLYACHRLSYKDLWRRWGFISANPVLAFQYAKILFRKSKATYHGRQLVRTKELIPSHDVSTQHQHHRDRVMAARAGAKLTSANGVVVLDGRIEDGHHRVAAYLEAGREWVEVEYWTSNA